MGAHACERHLVHAVPVSGHMTPVPVLVVLLALVLVVLVTLVVSDPPVPGAPSVVESIVLPVLPPDPVEVVFTSEPQAVPIAAPASATRPRARGGKRMARSIVSARLRRRERFSIAPERLAQKLLPAPNVAARSPRGTTSANRSNPRGRDETMPRPSWTWYWSPASTLLFAWFQKTGPPNARTVA